MKAWARVSGFLAKCGVNKEFGSSFVSWICYNLLISSLPIPLAYVTLSQGGSIESIGERGDFFVITAALLAGELPLISKVNKTRDGVLGDLLFGCAFILTSTCILSFVATSANFAVGHQQTKAASESSPPFPWFDSGAIMGASLFLYVSGILTVVVSIAWRAKGKGGDVVE
ncbi:hypothetical protein FE633_29180 [Streptomyces montanus]|uniref:Uncharacterized protein n=1 Tax=Streptomyces montanus TaxID=2580423 RepID=A0A5R9FHQ2_9ACTN|nr:hypothetical protein [Streptomyces montanus]TLS42731.1 hypothetical protein FE633_29180 [Streptomyces montanus]